MSGIIGTGGKSGVVGAGSREGWTLLETQTATNGGNIAIGSTSTISAKYDDYMIVGSTQLHTAESLIFRFTIGGSELASAYLTMSEGVDSAATTTNVTSGSYAYAFITSGSASNNNAYDRTDFKMYLTNPLSTVYQHRAWGIASYTTNQGYVRGAEFHARHNTTGVLSKVKVLGQSGNITGTLKLYGISK